jgi:hypothetical protein
MKHNSYFVETFAIYNIVNVLVLMNITFLRMNSMVFIDVIMMMFMMRYVLMICYLFSFLLDMKLTIQNF